MKFTVSVKAVVDAFLPQDAAKILLQRLNNGTELNNGAIPIAVVDEDGTLVETYRCKGYEELVPDKK